MSEERRDMSLFIGLHKLAEQNGDGLVPELYALLSTRAAQPDMTNVVPLAAMPRLTRNVPVADDGQGVVLAFQKRR
ncbi:hypothetical protein ACFFP0_02860 [Rhizobium puerariae]|uniref:Uncharacterized protein n=1 Tax=Rhizobium puerariae TaxID=1585791 RepID=A0ABV6AEI1_9HYPH